MKKSEDRRKWIESMIRDWVNTSPENTLGNVANDKAWDEPLVGFSRGDDPYWESFKEHVGPFHWTPAEAFMMAFPNGNMPRKGSRGELGSSPDEGHEDGNPQRKDLPAGELGQGPVLRGGGEREAPPVHPGGIEERGHPGRGAHAAAPVVADGFGSSSSLPRSGPSATPPSSRGWGPSGSPTASSRPGERP